MKFNTQPFPDGSGARTRAHALEVGEPPTEPSAEKAVGSRQADWRNIANVKQKERTEGNEQEETAHTKKYVARVELELQKICDGLLAENAPVITFHSLKNLVE